MEIEPKNPKAYFANLRAEQAYREARVDCDSNCGALREPKTLEEALAAVEHWRDHGFLMGCSHGC